jgi:uncharacterized membrane protein YhhN
MLFGEKMILIIFALIFAVFEWIGEYKANKKLIFLTKPTVMVLLIVWVWTYSDFINLTSVSATFPLVWFLVGLIFCLAGDVFLMLPPERFFMPGLVVFLVGHVFYIFGFGKIVLPAGTYAPAAVLAGLVLVVAITIYQKLIAGMKITGTARMKIPVTIYSIIITLMLISAFNTNFRGEWHYSSAWLVSFGALAFYFSDILNAWVRFRAPIPNGRVFIMITYHLGQIALAAGAVLHFRAM